MRDGSTAKSSTPRAPVRVAFQAIVVKSMLVIGRGYPNDHLSKRSSLKAWASASPGSIFLMRSASRICSSRRAEARIASINSHRVNHWHDAITTKKASVMLGMISWKLGLRRHGTEAAFTPMQCNCIKNIQLEPKWLRPIAILTGQTVSVRDNHQYLNNDATAGDYEFGVFEVATYICRPA